jgi:hypothetical protein
MGVRVRMHACAHATRMPPAACRMHTRTSLRSHTQHALTLYTHAHTRANHLRRADPLPGANSSVFAGGPYGSFCDSGGYMEGLMATINATWPHPGKPRTPASPAHLTVPHQRQCNEQ